MQRTTEFALTLKAGDRLEYTDTYGDKHTVTLYDDPHSLCLYSGAGTLIRDHNGAFIGLVAKLHHLQRGKPQKERVKPGTVLHGLDYTKIVPIGTIAHLGTAPQVGWIKSERAYWNGEVWVVIENGNLTTPDVMHVGDTFHPRDYRLTVVSVPEAKK